MQCAGSTGARGDANDSSRRFMDRALERVHRNQGRHVSDGLVPNNYFYAATNPPLEGLAPDHSFVYFQQSTNTLFQLRDQGDLRRRTAPGREDGAPHLRVVTASTRRRQAMDQAIASRHAADSPSSASPKK
jgi:hypothetical protein